MNFILIYIVFLVINLIAAYLWTGTNLEITNRYLRVVSYALLAATIGTFIASRSFGLSTLFYYLLNFIAGTILFEWDFKSAFKFIMIISIIELIFLMIYGGMYLI